MPLKPASLVRLQSPPQPGFRIRPVTLHRFFGDLQRFGNFAVIHADEEAEFDDFGAQRFLSGQRVQNFVNAQEPVRVGLDRQLDECDILVRHASAMPGRLFSTGAVHEDAPHGLRRRDEKVRATLPLPLILLNDPQPGLVNECGRLESLTRRFPRHLGRGECAQFLVNQRQQFLSGFGIALLNAVEDAGEVAHAPSILQSPDVTRLKKFTLDRGRGMLALR